MHELLLAASGLVVGDLLFFYRSGRSVERWFTRLANRRALAVALTAALALLPRLFLLPWLPIPDASIPDEFSFILGAQTFADGRLTNPVHPFWRHFETFHVNMVPTYQTQYQPAPSLFMALPLWFGAHYWWGVWLDTGLMAAAICWALQPLIGPPYALLAGIFVAFKYGVGTQYSDSYWGGSVAALGAALALGGFVRVIRNARLRDVMWLALGVGVLATSRPFEGFMFALPLAAGLLVYVWRESAWVRVLVPATAMLILLFGWAAYYNYRGTGNPAEMPYVANFRQYHFVQPFFGMALLPAPHYRYEVLRTFFALWEGVPGLLAQTPSGILELERVKLSYYYHQHLAPLVLLALLGLWAAVRSRGRAWLAWTALFVLLGLLAVVWWPLSSYAAPLLVSYFGLAFLGLRLLRTARIRGQRVGRYWVRGFAVVLLVIGIASLQDGARRQLYRFARTPGFGINGRPEPAIPWYIERLRVIHQLEKSGGEHLVFVKYAPWHIYHQEWVYGGPDIDRQRVVLARIDDSPDDCRLVNYYPHRKVWFVLADAEPFARLVPMDSILAPFQCPASPSLRARNLQAGGPGSGRW